MKAFLLSAGLGTRLRPLTNDLPKCLLPICGKPLLEIWLELFVLAWKRDSGGLCGFQGGELAKIVDIPLIVRSDDMQKVEDVHMVVVHMLMQRLGRENKDRGQRSEIRGQKPVKE